MRKRKFIEPIIHSIIWIGGFIIVANFFAAVGGIRNGFGNYYYSILSGTLFNIAIFYSVFFLQNAKSDNRIGWITLFTRMFSILIIATFLESIIDYFLFPHFFSSSQEYKISSLFLTLVVNDFILNSFFVGISLFYGFIKNWATEEKQKQELKSEKLSAELNFLKTQVNPHVLFNLLNMAFASATKSGDEVTADIVEKIASQMRYMLYESNVEKVALSKEIEHINGYVSLQKMRISPDMHVNILWTVLGKVDLPSIAPLLLIPFIENAFKYGISYDEQSEIKIELKCEDDILSLYVCNYINKHCRMKDDNSSGIGLENVKKRLELLYPEKHKLEICDNGKEFVVNLTLNLK